MLMCLTPTSLEMQAVVTVTGTEFFKGKTNECATDEGVGRT